jgi:hypothetical protein
MSDGRADVVRRLRTGADFEHPPVDLSWIIRWMLTEMLTNCSELHALDAIQQA